MRMEPLGSNEGQFPGGIEVGGSCTPALLFPPLGLQAEKKFSDCRVELEPQLCHRLWEAGLPQPCISAPGEVLHHLTSHCLVGGCRCSGFSAMSVVSAPQITLLTKD